MPPRAAPGAALSQGWGPPPLRRAEQDWHPHSRLCQHLPFSHSCILTLADGPEQKCPGLYTQHPWSPWGPPCCQTHSTRYLHPHASLPQFPSPPWTVSVSQGRGSQGWAGCWWSAKRCKEMTVTHNLLSRWAISSHSGLLLCSFKLSLAWYMQKILLHSPSVCC